MPGFRRRRDSLVPRTPGLIRHIPLAGLAILAVAFAVLFVGGGTRFAIGLVLKPIAEDFGWDRSVIGAAVAIFMLTTAVAMVVVGRLADRFAVSWILAGGLVLSACGIAAMAEITKPWQVLVLYGIVFSAGNGAVSIIPVGVMIMRRFPQRAASANGIAISGMGLGQLVIISGMTAVLAAAGWRPVFLGLGAITLILVPFLIWNGSKEQRGPPKPQPDSSAALPFMEILRRPVFWILLAIYAICGAQDFFVSTHVVAFASDHGADPLLAGNLLAFMGLAGLIGVVATGFWSDFSGPLAPLAASFVLRILLFGGILLVQDPLTIAIFALLFGITFWMSAVLLVVLVRDAFGTRHLGTVSGLITSVHHICGGISAFSGATVFDIEQSYDPVFLTLGIAAALSVGLVWLMPRRRQ